MGRGRTAPRVLSTTRPGVARFTVENGTYGPVARCPTCGKSFGFTGERVLFADIAGAALRHMKDKCWKGDR